MIRPYRDRNPAKFLRGVRVPAPSDLCRSSPASCGAFCSCYTDPRNPAGRNTTLTARTKRGTGDCKHTLRWLASGRGLCDGNIMMMQAAGGDRRGCRVSAVRSQCPLCTNRGHPRNTGKRGTGEVETAGHKRIAVDGDSTVQVGTPPTARRQVRATPGSRRSTALDPSRCAAVLS